MPEHPPSTGAPLAVLYLPPLGANRGDELAVLGRKLATALDRQSASGASRYEAVMGAREAAGQPQAVCRIVRHGPGEATPRAIADVFMVDYRDTLIARHRGRVLLSKCVLAAVGTIELSRRLLLHLLGSRPRRATRQEVFQTFMALGGMVVVMAYLALLVLSAARLVTGALDSPPSTSLAPTVATTSAQGPGASIGPGPATVSWEVNPGPPPSAAPGPATTPVTLASPSRHLPRVVQWWRESYQGAGVLMSLALLSRLLARDRAAVVDWVTRMSEDMLAFVFYLGMGDRRAEVTGMVDEHVEKLLEEGRGYGRVALMGYSFGSIVALDVLFPADDIRARRLDRVDTLVTLGSPVAFILTYWPGYFAQRSRRHAALKAWVNVFSPLDVLATQFDPPRPSPGEPALQRSHGTPDTLWRGPDREHAFREGAAEGRLTWFGAMTLLGLRAHSMYWAPEDGHERNCLHLVIADLFPGEAGAAPGDDAPSRVSGSPGAPLTAPHEGIGSAP